MMLLVIIVANSARHWYFDTTLYFLFLVQSESIVCINKVILTLCIKNVDLHSFFTSCEMRTMQCLSDARRV